MKVAFITTVYNEEKTIEKLLESVVKQTQKPDEIIVVDGGSRDGTWTKIQAFQKKYNNHFVIKIETKKGNRSVGRNEAVKIAKSNVIACSDAGCVLDKAWLAHIVKPFADDVDVVAGYYKADAKTTFEKCLAPYALVMEDKVNPKKFLPASRSMAFTKTIWEKAGGFPKHLSHNEDYAFAKKLQKLGARIVFAKDAIVFWKPRQNFFQAFGMFFRFAMGDIQAGIMRPKVVFLFLRYSIAIGLLLYGLRAGDINVLVLLALLFSLYIGWAIEKNYLYVKQKKAFLLLPVLQFTADSSVILGTSIGVIKKLLGLKYQ